MEFAQRRVQGEFKPACSRAKRLPETYARKGSRKINFYYKKKGR